MPTKDEVRELFERYTKAMTAGDADAWVACFADDATHEDPVGAPVLQGKDAIKKFFANNPPGVTLSMTGEPLVIGNEALVFLRVDIETDGTKMELPRIVDHVRLTDDGRIQALRAFFDFNEMRPAG